MNPPGVVLSEVTVEAGGETLIEGVSFNAPSGATTVLLGATDSGASTAIKAIAGLARPRAGRILVRGADVTRARPGRRNVAVVFESHTLFPHMTVFENVAYPLKVARMDAGEIKRKVDAIAVRLGFAASLGSKPRDVPEGVRRRAGLARAIVREPAAYLFNRTLASLDDDFRGAAREAIGFLREQAGATILVPSADAGEAARLADWLVVMEAGRVLQEGEAGAVRHRPATLSVANWVMAPALALKDAIVLAVRPDGLSIRLDDGRALDVAVETEGVEVGERVNLGAAPGQVDGRSWDEVDGSSFLVFDSTGRALAGRPF